ncbi:MAG: hypothetical protein JRN45_00295 [Nitrososphaerota archaeon]|nr:hypothetical protein [Nitrososphaerota archaeon]
MKSLIFVVVVLLLAGLASPSALPFLHPHVGDPCDGYGDCVSSSVSYVRSNPDHTLYLGDSFVVPLSIMMGPNTTDYSLSWSYDHSVFDRSGDTFSVVGNDTGTFSIEASVTFSGTVPVGNTTQPFSSTLATGQSVTIIPLIISLRTQMVNITDSHGFALRNPDGTFYRNDSFCESWSATFQFAAQRTDIKINITSVAPPLQVLNYSADELGRTGRFCYVVETGAGYGPYNATLVARALNWQGLSLALTAKGQPFALVQYDPQFTAYSYMVYGNVTTPSSLERPWVLFVRYDGNDPGYSYAGDANTLPFNGSETLAERAYFDNFTFTSLSYQPSNFTGAFTYHMVNSTGSLRYRWLNENDSAMMGEGKRIEKYIFEVRAPSLEALLSQGYAYQNITMSGRWTHEAGYALKKSYWLDPFLWSGRLTIVSVGSNGRILPDAPVTLTIKNPQPLDDWLVRNFEGVFGNDTRAVRAFEADLYPTNSSMSFSGKGSLSLWFNQTSLSPPLVSITVGGVTLSGNFTFIPTFVNSTIKSIPNSLNGTVFYANATVPFWSYNMVQGGLAFLPVSTTIDHPTTFLELVNNGSSGWIAGNTTAPQTPSAFASQGYGFWPMGENLTVYANLQGGGIDLLGTQKAGPSEYQASFYIEPWSGGISSAQLVEGGTAASAQSTLNAGAYPSPLPTALTGIYSVTYPATGQDTKVVFTNVWGAKTTIDLGTPAAPPSAINLIPTTTAAAFGIALMVWFVVNRALKTRRGTPAHD